MDLELKNQLLQIAKAKIPNTDVSHDFMHAERVLSNAERIRTKFLIEFFKNSSWN